MSERLWIDPVTGDWGFHSDAPKTLRVNPTADEQWKWSRQDRCVHCGQWGRPLDACRCRRCSSCSSVWIADRFADYSDGRPAHEYCPECIAAKCRDCGLSSCHDIHDGAGAGKHPFNDGECTAMVPYNPRFNFWAMVGDSLERALIEDLKALGASMQRTTIEVQRATRTALAWMN